MSLFLVELAPSNTEKAAVTELLETVSQALSASGAELIESQVTAGHERVFVILEATSPDGIFNSVKDAVGELDVDGPHEVRLVGAELEDIKNLKKSAEYLVEWDIPAEITMDQYLTRKKANSPKYAEVPEVQFLRTYVREDTAKCLCFYDAPDEEAVVRAREAVSTPIDRMHKLDV
ncbi:DUF4242 domain-containing protein [Kocuria sp.]|uniref:DUF4242 domain-containing protein n=1 Tax=Kocuria sp. TaxID=1871328 RepID=UPI0026DF6295|nr:DUF4242 domain-containing protein [Kocuria sp.]MDO5617878.1 DUF4242 domain-containing protein [Kocuria sp.]